MRFEGGPRRGSPALAVVVANMNKPDDFDCWRLPDDGSVAKCASHCMPRRTRHTLSSAELTKLVLPPRPLPPQGDHRTRDKDPERGDFGNRA